MHEYKLIENRQLTPTTILITLQKEPHSEPFIYESGQYAAISFMHRGRPTPARCFSIVSSPAYPDMLQFSTRPRGHFTKALSRLSVGEPVKVRGPFGDFTIDPLDTNPVVMIAGGIGITPFMSMIRFATTSRSKQKMTLIYSNQSQTDVPFIDELQQLEKDNPNFKVIFVVSDGPTTLFRRKYVPKGRITLEVLDKAVSGIFDNKSYYICGPPPFMAAMSKIIEKKGGKNERIVTEAFSQGSKQKAGSVRTMPLNVYTIGAMGVVMSSFIVMVADLLKLIPPAPLIGPSAGLTTTATPTNSRQADLDTLVSGLAPVTAATPQTAAAKASAEQLAAAEAAVAAAVAANAGTTGAVSTSTSGSKSTTTTTTPATTKTSTTTTTTTPTTVVTPTPTPTKTCTTTQSGVTTCV
jgi:ferredoxin-NADP reductase